MKFKILILLAISLFSINKIQARMAHSSGGYKELLLNIPETTDKNFQRSWQVLTQHYRSFPDRLLLPRGKTEGMPMQLFFIVTPATDANVVINENGAIQKRRKCTTDGKAYGFPFDRLIDGADKFHQPNMYFKDVKIFHDENYITENFRA